MTSAYIYPATEDCCVGSPVTEEPTKIFLKKFTLSKRRQRVGLQWLAALNTSTTEIASSSFIALDSR